MQNYFLLKEKYIAVPGAQGLKYGEGYTYKTLTGGLVYPTSNSSEIMLSLQPLLWSIPHTMSVKATVSANTVKVSWNKVPFASGYSVYRVKDGNEPDWEKPDWDVKGLQITDTTPINDGKSYYLVIPYEDYQGNGMPTAEAVDPYSFSSNYIEAKNGQLVALNQNIGFGSPQNYQIKANGNSVSHNVLVSWDKGLNNSSDNTVGDNPKWDGILIYRIQQDYLPKGIISQITNDFLPYAWLLWIGLSTPLVDLRFEDASDVKTQFANTPPHLIKRSVHSFIDKKSTMSNSPLESNIESSDFFYVFIPYFIWNQEFNANLIYVSNTTNVTEQQTQNSTYYNDIYSTYKQTTNTSSTTKVKKIPKTITTINSKPVITTLTPKPVIHKSNTNILIFGLALIFILYLLNK